MSLSYSLSNAMQRDIYSTGHSVEIESLSDNKLNLTKFNPVDSNNYPNENIKNFRNMDQSTSSVQLNNTDDLSRFMNKNSSLSPKAIINIIAEINLQKKKMSISDRKHMLETASKIKDISKSTSKLIERSGHINSQRLVRNGGSLLLKSFVSSGYMINNNKDLSIADKYQPIEEDIKDHRVKINNIEKDITSLNGSDNTNYQDDAEKIIGRSKDNIKEIGSEISSEEIKKESLDNYNNLRKKYKSLTEQRIENIEHIVYKEHELSEEIKSANGSEDYISSLMKDIDTLKNKESDLKIKVDDTLKEIDSMIDEIKSHSPPDKNTVNNRIARNSRELMDSFDLMNKTSIIEDRIDASNKEIEGLSVRIEAIVNDIIKSEESANNDLEQSIDKLWQSIDILIDMIYSSKS